MPKICKKENCEYRVFGKGYCKIHQYLRTDLKEKVKIRSRISPISQKELKRLAKYRPIRDKFLEENPTCCMEGCNGKSELHHKKGRIGDLLWDVRYFLNVCRSHHQIIEINPEWAYENGYSIRRNGK